MTRANRKPLLHSDQSERPITLPLNDRSQYEGGGTFFAALDRAVNCDTGGLVVFPRAVPRRRAHLEGEAAYVIVAFLFEDSDKDERRGLDGADRKLDGDSRTDDSEDEFSRLPLNMNDQC